MCKLSVCEMFPEPLYTVTQLPVTSLSLVFITQIMPRPLVSLMPHPKLSDTWAFLKSWTWIAIFSATNINIVFISLCLTNKLNVKLKRNTSASSQRRFVIKERKCYVTYTRYKWLYFIVSFSLFLFLDICHLQNNTE